MAGAPFTVTLTFRNRTHPAIHIDAKNERDAQTVAASLLRQYAAVKSCHVDDNTTGDRHVADANGTYLFTIPKGGRS